jgi:hypothetical protein
MSFPCSVVLRENSRTNLFGYFTPLVSPGGRKRLKAPTVLKRISVETALSVGRTSGGSEIRASLR